MSELSDAVKNAKAALAAAKASNAGPVAQAKAALKTAQGQAFEADLVAMKTFVVANWRAFALAGLAAVVGHFL